ncbi:alpha/beta fold hydrolase [Nesterenkonia populi]|uniref:alpha/beta fold hydrolase n=1 Tax=Nesterenkonia populi TaxID=1591087 RepID=UPI001478DB07|nr:alpha/beta fold hydrolase [Nesterenkonia populi]
MSGQDAVLLHGAWTGAWVWGPTAARLRQAGHRPHALALPGTGPRADMGAELSDAVDHVLRFLERLPGPSLLVAHGSAGPIAAAVGERAPHLVRGTAYVAGLMLPARISYARLGRITGYDPTFGGAGCLAAAHDHRASELTSDAAWEMLLHDVRPEDACPAILQMGPQSEAVRLGIADWTLTRFESVPRLYVETTHDRCIPLHAQRRMQQAAPGAETASLPTGHLPMLAAPRLLVEHLLDFARSLHPASTPARLAV